MTRSGDLIARIALAAYDDYCVEFAAITARAGVRFADRDWHGLQADSVERLELYNTRVDQAVAELTSSLGSGASGHDSWAAARKEYDQATTPS